MGPVVVPSQCFHPPRQVWYQIIDHGRMKGDLMHISACFIYLPGNLIESNKSALVSPSALSLPDHSTEVVPNSLIANSARVSDENDSVHQYSIQFLPRFKYRRNFFHEKKHVREVAVVKPHDLVTVRDFLMEIIAREQRYQQKLVIPWDSVQKRYQTMVTDVNSTDRDLFARYQPKLGFFPDSMDEQLLEVWTGKGSVVDVFSLPEFEGLECVREPLPPYDLLVVARESQKLSPKTNTVAVGTDECDGSSAGVKLQERTRKKKRQNQKTFKEGCCILDTSNGLEPDCTAEECLTPTRLWDNTVKNMCGSAHEPKAACIAPEAKDLPNPLTFFEQSVDVSDMSSLKNCSDSQESKTQNCDNLSEFSTCCESFLRSRGVVTSEFPSSCFHSSTTTLSSSESPSELKDPLYRTFCTTCCVRTDKNSLSFQRCPYEELLLSDRMTLESEKSSIGGIPQLESAHYTQNHSICNLSCQTTPLSASVTSSFASASPSREASPTTSIPPQNNGLVQESSVLDDLLFPQTDDTLNSYLDFIRKAVAVRSLNHGALPEMKDVLKDLHENVSAKWVDYVLMYIPEVSVLPYDGKIFMVWKGK
ncbi:hypothetical protein RB195_014989 [Necator americanus]|uniref:Uncharacterized protein n=1 Tax=Necator americanus TaxID=51031 RepID=A0ABR1E2J0_NECAM